MSLEDTYNIDYLYFSCSTCSNFTVVTPVGVVPVSGEFTCTTLTCIDFGTELTTVTREDFLSGQGLV